MDFSSLAALVLKQQQHRYQQAAEILKHHQQQQSQQIYQHQKQQQHQQHQQQLHAQILEALHQKEHQNQIVVAQVQQQQQQLQQQQQQHQLQALHLANSNYQSILASLLSKPSTPTQLLSKQATLTEIQQTNFIGNHQQFSINPIKNVENHTSSFSPSITGGRSAAPYHHSMVKTLHPNCNNIGPSNRTNIVQTKNSMATSAYLSSVSKIDSDKNISRSSEITSTSTLKTKIKSDLNPEMEQRKQKQFKVEQTSNPSNNFSEKEKSLKDQTSTQNCIMEGNLHNNSDHVPSYTGQNSSVKTSSQYLSGEQISSKSRKAASNDMDNNAMAISSLALYVEQRKKEDEEMSTKNKKENASVNPEEKVSIKTNAMTFSCAAKIPGTEVINPSIVPLPETSELRNPNDEAIHHLNEATNPCEQPSNTMKEDLLNNNFQPTDTRQRKIIAEEIPSGSVFEQKATIFSGKFMVTPNPTQRQISGIQENNNTEKLSTSQVQDQTSTPPKDIEKQKEALSLEVTHSSSFTNENSTSKDSHRVQVYPVKQENSSNANQRQTKASHPTGNIVESKRPYGYNNPYKNITPEQIAKSIPQNASSIFHIFDRRVNLDAHSADTSLYALMRSWVKDDPYRISESNMNLQDHSTVPSMRRRQDSNPFNDFRSTDETQNKLRIKNQIDSRRRPYKKRKIDGVEKDTCDIISKICNNNTGRDCEGNCEGNPTQTDNASNIQSDIGMDSCNHVMHDLLQSHIELAKLKRKDKMKGISIRMNKSKESLKNLGINLP